MDDRADRELLRSLRRTSGLLDAAGQSPVLIGAAAVRLHVAPGAFVGRPPPIDPDIPQTLIAAVEATADIDFVVKDFAASERVLTANGFARSERHLVTFIKGEESIDVVPSVDLLTSTSVEHPIHIPFAACVPGPLILPDGSGSIAIAAPGALIALKAHAYYDRSTASDLADLCALCLAQALGELDLMSDLRRAVAVLQQMEASMAGISERFKDAYATGPGAFFEVVRKLTGHVWNTDWAEQHESPIRELASEAVRRVLRDL